MEAKQVQFENEVTNTNRLLKSSVFFHFSALWCGVVLLAIGLFVGQVAYRIAAYFQYKSNVDVKVKYVDEMDFPAVTICNQNNYRLAYEQ